MAIYGTPLLIGGGGGGMNDTLPPLLNDFFAVRDELTISVSADKIKKGEGPYLAGAVWVYNEHLPQSVNDGTKIEIGRDELFVSSFFLETKTIQSLPSKSKIKLGRYGGKDLQWLLCRNSENKIFLILTQSSMAVLGNKIFDNKEPNNPNSERKSFGNNNYPLSNLHQWVNADGAENEWFKKTHTYDTPPDYANQKGFLNEWSKEEKEVVLETTWTTTKTNADGGGKENFSSKLTLPSTAELGLDSTGGGSKLDIFSNNTDRKTDRIYWTRNPGPNYPYYVKAIKTDGATEAFTVLTSEGVRPLLAIDGKTLVSGSTDSDGCYTLILKQKIKKQVTFPKEKDFYVRQFTYNTKKQFQTMLEGAVYHIKAGG